MSSLPVVTEAGVLLDVYARADITALCKGNAYSRLAWEDVTVRVPRAAAAVAACGGGCGLRLAAVRAPGVLTPPPRRPVTCARLLPPQVGQALSLCSPHPVPWQQQAAAAAGGSSGQLGADFGAAGAGAAGRRCCAHACGR